MTLLLLLLSQAQAERVAVAAALSELELLVTKLVGVGIYDLQPKTWQQRLKGRTSVDELCKYFWLLLNRLPVVAA